MEVTLWEDKLILSKRNEHPPDLSGLHGRLVIGELLPDSSSFSVSKIGTS